MIWNGYNQIRVYGPAYSWIFHGYDYIVKGIKKSITLYMPWTKMSSQHGRCRQPLSLSQASKQASKQTFANANCLPKIKMSYWNFAKYRSSILHTRVQHPREKANIQGTCTITRIFALAKKRLLKHLLLQIPSCPPLHLPGRVCSPVLFTASVCLATYGVSKDKWSSYDQVHVDTRVRSLIHQNSTIVHMRLDF